jgi:hypothetical protein
MRRPVLTLLIAATAVHAGVLAAVHTRTGRLDGYAFNSLDCAEYYRVAQNVARHGVFSQSPEPPLTPDTWRTPGYPLFLAAVMLVLGDSPGALVIVQQLLSVLNVLLVYRIARSWMGSGRAVAVAALFLVEPYHLFYSLWLLSTTLFVTVLLLAWLVWIRGLRSGRWWWFGLLGAAGGVLVLVRPIAALIPVVLLLGLVLRALLAIGRVEAQPRDGALPAEAEPTVGPLPRRRGSERGPRHRFACLFAFAVACGAIIGSWMFRNHAAAGHFALSDQSGVVLAYFKAAEVTLWREGRTAERYIETTLAPERTGLPHTVWDEIDERLRERFTSLPEARRQTLRWQNLAQGNRTEVDSFEVSRALREIAWGELSVEPTSTVACLLARCGSILVFPLNLALRPPEWGDPRAPQSSGLRRLRWGLLGCVYLIVTLAVPARLARRRLNFEQTFFPLACVAALLLATTPQIDPRFRVPMIPLLLVLSILPTIRKTDSPAAAPAQDS